MINILITFLYVIYFVRIDAATYPSSYQLNYKTSDLLGGKLNTEYFSCDLCYKAYYGNITTRSTLLSKCTSGTEVFIGGTTVVSASSTITIGAFISTSQFTTLLNGYSTNAKNSYTLYNGLYWYCSNPSFGFSSTTTISQALVSGDTASGSYKLSWIVDGTNNGGRVGATSGLKGSLDYYQVAYQCYDRPTGQPTGQPSRQPSSQPSKQVNILIRQFFFH